MKLKLIFPIIFIGVFFTLAGKTEAANWYVSTSGSGSGTCSNTSNYCTFARALAVATAGDTIRVNAGTYTATQGLPWIVSKAITLEPEIGESVVLDGGLNISTWTSMVPATIGAYTSLIRIDTDSVTVRGFTIQNCGGEGIRLFEANNCLVENNYITKTYYNGIYLLNSDNNTIRNNTTEYTSLKRLHLANAWSAGITVSVDNASKSSNNNIIESNVVRYSHGEGIDVVRGRSNNTISGNIARRNQIYNVRMVGVYFGDGTNNNLAEENLIYCTAQDISAYWPSQVSCTTQGALSFKDEKPATYGYSVNNVFKGNSVFGVSRCMQLSATDDGSTPIHHGHKVFNNTCVNPQNIGYWCASTAQFSDVEIRNNIGWCNGETGACAGGKITEVSTTNGITWSHNLLYGATVDSQSAGIGDIYLAPLISKTTGWTLSGVVQGTLTGQEFAIITLSPAKDVGYNLGATYDDLLDLGSSNYLTRSFTELDQDLNGAGWEIGADVYVVSNTTPPSAPSGLAVK